MIFELQPLGNGARISMNVTNNSDEDIVIEAVPRRLGMSEDGTETLSDASDDLLIFPPIAQIPAGSRQVLQVQYIGDPDIDTSVAYRVSVEQVPVGSAANGSGSVGLSTNMHTLLNVVPPGARSSLSVTRVSPSSAEGELEIDIENSGSRFARLSETRWIIERDGQRTEVEGRDVRKLSSGNLLLPGSSRRLTLSGLPNGIELEGAAITIEGQ